jgi:uncharacterized protein (DUF885 family)
MRCFTQLLLLSSLVCVGLAPGATAQQPTPEDLTKLFEDAWESYLAEDPVFATRFGDHRWDDQLASESLADHQRRLEQRRTYLERWEGIDRSQLRRPDQINYDLFGQLLKDEIAEG